MLHTDIEVNGHRWNSWEWSHQAFHVRNLKYELYFKQKSEYETLSNSKEDSVELNSKSDSFDVDFKLMKVGGNFWCILPPKVVLMLLLDIIHERSKQHFIMNPGSEKPQAKNIFVDAKREKISHSLEESPSMNSKKTSKYCCKLLFKARLW